MSASIDLSKDLENIPHGNISDLNEESMLSMRTIDVVSMQPVLVFNNIGYKFWLTLEEIIDAGKLKQSWLPKE